MMIDALESRTLLSISATLSASTINIWQPTYTFYVTYLAGQRIRTAQLDSHDVTITGPNGYSTTGRLISFVDNVKKVVARYKAITPAGIWDASDNGVYTVSMNGRQVSDRLSNYVVPGAMGTFKAQLPAYPSDVGAKSPTALGGIDVTSFGATPNNNSDDTTAIQNAINSLPRLNGIPNATGTIGGTVFLPAGTFNISHPLMISSGVTLRGTGAATILNDTSTDGTNPAIQLVCYFTHGTIARLGVQDMTINSIAAKGIAPANSTTGVVGMNLQRLTFNTVGTAVDLRINDVYATTISDITINNPATSAFWMVIADGNTALDYISNLVVQGAASANFTQDTGMVMLGGYMEVDGLSIGDTGAPGTPLVITRGGIDFHNVSLPQNVSNGVLLNINSYRVQFDQIADISATRRLVLSDLRDLRVKKLSVANGSTLAQSISLDSMSHLTADRLYTNGGIGNVSAASVTVRQQFAGATLRTPAPVLATHAPGAAAIDLVNVTAFGATPDDNTDDTAAIQAAIDSLPRGNGLPGANVSNLVGGTVILPEGTFNLSSPLRIPSGVWLEGQGGGTVLASSSTDSSSAEILLVSGALVGYNIGAGVNNLTLRTDAATGIRGDSSVSTALVDPDLSGLIISTGGTGIDLRGVKTFHANVANNNVVNPGSDALWIGDDAGYSADNFIQNFQLSGSARSGFSGDRALFVFAGQNTVDNLWIEQSTAAILPLYITGSADFHATWLEYPAQFVINATEAELENTTSVSFDFLMAVDYGRRLVLRNAKNVNIDYLNIADAQDTLNQCVDLDSTSSLHINTVNSIYDSGMLNNGGVTVAANYDQTTATYTETSLVQSSQNIVDDIGDWQVKWSDNFGTVTGTSSVDSGGMHLHISSNPNSRSVAVIINLNVADAMIGKQAIASWEMDGPPTVITYTTSLAHQYATRAMYSQTAIIDPSTLQHGDQLIVILPAVSSGDFYISNVMVNPI